MKFIQLVPGLSPAADIVTLIIFAIASIFAAAGGVGGGTVNVSTLIALGVDSKTAVALSHSIIFAGSFTQMPLNILERVDFIKDEL